MKGELDMSLVLSLLSNYLIIILEYRHYFKT